MQMRFKFGEREGPSSARRAMGRQPKIHHGVIIEVFISDHQLERRPIEELQRGVGNIVQRALIIGKTEAMSKAESGKKE